MQTTFSPRTLGASLPATRIFKEQTPFVTSFNNTTFLFWHFNIRRLVWYTKCTACRNIQCRRFNNAARWYNKVMEDFLDSAEKWILKLCFFKNYFSEKQRCYAIVNQNRKAERMDVFRKSFISLFLSFFWHYYFSFSTIYYSVRWPCPFIYRRCDELAGCVYRQTYTAPVLRYNSAT